MLYIVATPIGNLKDISQRAIEVLSEVDLIAAEDTRVTARLLQAYNIKTAMTSYHDFSDQHQLDIIMTKLRQGQSIALVSDAGTPLISDPGYRLVRAARLENIDVVPVPGPSAVIAALCASGLACERFAFEGFIPAKQGPRLKLFTTLEQETRTMVFYEAPRRLIACLEDMLKVFGAQRELVIAREITKRFETFRRGTVLQLLTWVREDVQQLKGECVLVVSARLKEKRALQELDAEVLRIAQLLATELPPKKTAAVTAKITGADKKAIYNAVIGKDE